MHHNRWLSSKKQW